MSTSGKVVGYLAEPVLATLTLALAGDFCQFRQMAAFMHTEARDILSILLVLLTATLALWVGLFWVSNTSFGSWLIEKGELDALQFTYIYSAGGIFTACLGCVVGAYVEGTHVITQNVVLWLTLFSLYSLPVLLNNTRLLLKLHAAYAVRSRRVTQMDRAKEN